MYNKRAGRVDLGKYKKPNPYKQDIIVDPMGQWKYPGQPTRIPGNQITMQGVPYPVLGIDNLGNEQMMYPDQNYTFPGQYVDEYPMAKKGGVLPKLPNKKSSKRYSRNVLATNKLFAQNSLTKKAKSPKGKIFDPYAKYFQVGGIPYDQSGPISELATVEDYTNESRPRVYGHEPEDYSNFLAYSATAPENRRAYSDYVYGNPDDYDQYGFWDSIGKPKDWETALKIKDEYTGEPLLQPDPYDNMYHGFSINPNTGVFLKSGKPGLKPGDTTWMEIAGHYQGRDAQNYTPVFDPDLGRFKYIPSEKDGGFHTDLNKHRKFLRDWTYGQSIGMLQKQVGGDISIPELTKAQTGQSMNYPSWYKGQSLDSPIPDFTGGDPRMKQENKYSTIGQYFDALKTKADTIDQAPYKMLTYLGDPKAPKGHYDPEQGKYVYYNRRGGLIKAQDGHITVSPFSYHGDTPGLYRFDTQNPTFNVGYTQPFGSRAVNRLGVDAMSAGLTAKLPYMNNTGMGIQGNLHTDFDEWHNFPARMETDLSLGYDPKLGFHSGLIASPQFTFGNVQPTRSKVYGTGLKSGEFIANVGPFAGASAVPGRKTVEERFSMPAGVKGNIDFGIGRKGIKAGLSGYAGADLMGSGLESKSSESGLKPKFNYGIQANLKLPIKSTKEYLKELLTQKEIQDRDYTPKIQYGGLPRAQVGLDNGVVKSKTQWAGAPKVTGDPNSAPVIYEGKDVTVKAKGPEWAGFQREYQSANPWERYLAGEKNKYIRKNKGLNKAAGVTASSFPKAAEDRIRAEYDRKMNTYITRRLGHQFGFNPRERGEWIDLLTEPEKKIVAGSKYASKLNPSIWSRTMSGAQESLNTIATVNPAAMAYSALTGKKAPRISNQKIPGYTESEMQAAKENPFEAAEVLAITELPAAYIANRAKNANVENPSFLSGEVMPNVTAGDLFISNPLLALEAVPSAWGLLGKTAARGVRNLGKGAKTLGTGMGKVAEKVLPQYKNVYRVEPTSFTKSSDLSGRWFGSDPEQLKFYVENLKNPDAGIRIMRSKIPVKKWESLSGVNMPERAKQMSAGKGMYKSFTDAANAGQLSHGAAKRLTKGVQIDSDINELFNNPSLINLSEGILPEAMAMKIRTSTPGKFSRYGKVEFPGGDLGKQGSKDYLKNISSVVEKPIMGIPRQYIPFQEGGESEYEDLELTPEEIDWYLTNGYDLEMLPDDYELPISQLGSEFKNKRFVGQEQPVVTKPVAKEKALPNKNKTPLADKVFNNTPAQMSEYAQNLLRSRGEYTPKPTVKAPVKQSGLTPYAENLMADRKSVEFEKRKPVPEKKGITSYAKNLMSGRGDLPTVNKTINPSQQLTEQEEYNLYNTLSENLMTFGDKLSRFMDPQRNLYDQEVRERANAENEQLKRFAQKTGITDIQEGKLDLKKSKAKAPVKKVTPKPAKFYQELGTVKDVGYSDNDLLSYRNQWDNKEGFEYIATPVKKDRKGNEVYSNVKGVGHFLLDASVSGKTYSHEYNKKFIENAKKNNEWIPAFQKVKGDRVRLQYKKPDELTKADIVVTPLRQMKYDEIKFDQTQRPEGFQKGIKEVKKSDGKGTYLLFKDRDGYSRFSGGSVVFIFKDQYGNTIVRDYAGSLNGIENEGIQIKKQYKLKPGELTIGYHDVGSYSAKPKADKNNVLKVSQWDGFNNNEMTGGALLIPND